MKNHFKNKNMKLAERTNKNAGIKKYKKCKTTLNEWNLIESAIKDKIRRERALFVNSTLHSCSVN